MRILFICSGHGIDDDRVARKEAVSLTRMGHKVTVCAQKRLAYQEPRLRLVDVDSLEVMQQIETQKSKDPSRLHRVLRLRNLYLLAKRDAPDLIVAHEYETGVLAWWIKRRLKIPFVFDAHECYEETMPLVFPQWARPIAKWFLLKLLRQVVRNACGVTVASPAALAYTLARQAGLPSRVLHNAPILEYFPYSEEESDTPIIVHEGNLTFERGALEILDALALVRRQKEFRFLVLGTIPDEVLAPFQVKVGNLDLKGVVDMRGRLPWTEFGKIQATGQIGLICSQPVPNHMLSLSNKLYNYMACGLAVLGMKGSETEKIIQQYQCGITVDTSQPQEIAKGITWLIDHPEERRVMARNGRKAIEQELGWHCMEKVMGELYGEIEKKIESSKVRAC